VNGAAGGTNAGLRVLIVNADDFGLSSGVNAGVAVAHEQGVVTSASLMVRQPAAEEAAGYAREHPELAVGLHVELGEWQFVDGVWRQMYEVAPLTDRPLLEREIQAQLDSFRRLLGREPTHLDSHQHLHLNGPAAEVLAEHGAQLGIPVRDVTNGVRYSGAFYGQSDKGYAHPEAITTASLVALLGRLEPGVTEVSCHPAASVDFDSVYLQERVEELATLCDPRVRDAIAAESIALRSFAELAAR